MSAATPHVTLVSTYYYPVVGGVETHARQLARALVADGWQVAVVTRRTPPGRPTREVIDGADVRAVAPRGARNTLGKWLMVGPALAELLRIGRATDLVVCVDLRTAGIAAVVGGRLIGRRVVLQAATPGAVSHAHWDSHLARLGLDPQGSVARALKWPLTALYASADAHVCVTAELADEARRAGVAPGRIHSIPHGVDLERFRPVEPTAKRELRAALGWPVDRRIVLFVGRLSREKGVMDLLEAWARLDDPTGLLVLVGPDMVGHRYDVGDEARRFAENRGLAARVRFHGAVDDPSPLMQAADVFVQPSHYEAFGISAMEAIAAGLPTVATAVGGLLDFLVDGENALLCRAEDPESLATALARLVADVALAERLGRSARATAEARFDERLVTARYLAIFRDLAARPRP